MPVAPSRALGLLASASARRSPPGQVEVRGLRRQMTKAAAIESKAAPTVTGRLQDRGIAKSPSSDDITLHSRSAGAAAFSPAIARSCLAVLVMAVCRA